ncbi:MAG: hypothetical protein ACXWF8_01055 [Methylobacter sp.]
MTIGNKSKLNLVVLLGLMLLSACRAVSTPEQTTAAFWEAMADGDAETARDYATQETRQLVVKQQNLEDASVKTGSAALDGSNAKVPTTMTLSKNENSKTLSFDTVLLKENGRWQIDYQRTLNNVFNLPFGDIFKSLLGLGETFNKELERQMPLFEQQIKTFSEEFVRQLDEFRRQMEKSIPPEQQKRRPGSI